jgi:sterol desaturase/sphingolipid hydroxylase (fatty acid hydroxylase superfamily)
MELFARPEDLMGIAIAGGVVALMFGMAMWRQFVPPKPVQLVRQDWMRFEQRRWSNPGATLRLLLWLAIAIVTIGGTIAVPWGLGVAQSPGWYLNEWWIGLFFVAVAVTVVTGFLIARRAVHRCPTCRSAHLGTATRKGNSRQNRELIYVCRACEIVWRTGLSNRHH